jgi:hypothetical protein
MMRCWAVVPVCLALAACFEERVDFASGALA